MSLGRPHEGARPSEAQGPERQARREEEGARGQEEGKRAWFMAHITERIEVWKQFAYLKECAQFFLKAAMQSDMEDGFVIAIKEANSGKRHGYGK